MPVRFTVCIPSYNGGQYLRQSVESVLAQTFEDFELLILDDASTDGSVDWVKSLNHKKIRLLADGKRYGIVDNWRRTLTSGLGEYLTILGQDDSLDPNYLEVMDQLIRRHPDAGLYHAHFRFMDETGATIRPSAPMPEQETAAQYIEQLYTQQRDTYGTGYLMKSSRYLEAGGIPPYTSLLFADDALWIKMMLGSYKATANENCFSCRMYPHSTGAAAKWDWWLSGLKSYGIFLQESAAQDPAFGESLSKNGPEYFLRQCSNMFLLSIVQATKLNRRADKKVADLFRDALTGIAPAKVPEFDAFLQGKSVRLRFQINRNPLARFAYNFYILTRYREWRTKPLRRPGS